MFTSILIFALWFGDSASAGIFPVSTSPSETETSPSSEPEDSAPTGDAGPYGTAAPGPSARPFEQSSIEPASRAGCTANKSTDVVSVNIGFGYRKTPSLDLKQAPTNDSKFYQQMASGFATKTKIATMNDTAAPEGTTKVEFLNRLRSVIGSAKVVNLNYAGHGLQLPNGEFGLVLPSVSDDAVKTCFTRVDPDQRGLARINPTILSCDDVMKHIVTASDLKGVIGDRKVFGIIDACHAGSFDLGPNSSMLLASQSNEKSAQDGVDAGAFTNAIKKKLGEMCRGDLDGDQQISQHELTMAMAGDVRPTQMAATRGLGRIMPAFQREFQHPVLNGRSWTDCFIPKNTSATPCRRSFRDGEHLETTSPAEATDESNKKSCLLKSGTRVQALEANAGTEGRIKVEVPSHCGFTEGRVPMTQLRNDGAFGAPERAPGSTGEAGSAR